MNAPNQQALLGKHIELASGSQQTREDFHHLLCWASMTFTVPPQNTQTQNKQAQNAQAQNTQAQNTPTQNIQCDNIYIPKTNITKF